MKLIKKILKGFVFLIIAFVVIGMLFGGDKEEKLDLSSSPATEPATVSAEKTPEPVKEDPKAPLEHRMARESAQNYINLMGFSQQGLIKQLEFEKHPADAISYAIENIKVDWNEEAKESATNYLDTASFSAEGLRKQLAFENFSEEQIDYAMANIDPDWNEQALESAKNYISLMSMSMDQLKNQLAFEGFTSEQIAYALENLE